MLLIPLGSAGHSQLLPGFGCKGWSRWCHLEGCVGAVKGAFSSLQPVGIHPTGLGLCCLLTKNTSVFKYPITWGYGTHRLFRDPGQNENASKL